MTRPYNLIIKKLLNLSRHHFGDFLTVTDKREAILATCFYPDYQLKQIEKNYSEGSILKIRQIRLTALRSEHERSREENRSRV